MMLSSKIWETLQNSPYSIIIANDYYRENFTDDIHVNTDFSQIRLYNHIEELIEDWYKIAENPPSMWYWILDRKKVFCSGAIDPDDINIIKEHFNKKYFDIDIQEEE